MEQNRKYPVSKNLAYCVRATRQGYPKLLVFCLLLILMNCLVPVMTAFLPKIVIDEITNSLQAGCHRIRAGNLVFQILETVPVDIRLKIRNGLQNVRAVLAPELDPGKLRARRHDEDAQAGDVGAAVGALAGLQDGNDGRRQQLSGILCLYGH